MYKSKYIHRGTLSQTVPGCVTRHTCHASVTHFRPISGNIVEVTLVTSPNLYINSHAKGTGFPLVRMSQGQPVLVFSPITDLIFKRLHLQLRCRWSLLKIKSVIGCVDMYL